MARVKDRIQVPEDHPDRPWAEWVFDMMEGDPLSEEVKSISLSPLAGGGDAIVVRFWIDKKKRRHGSFVMPLESLKEAWLPCDLVDELVADVYKKAVPEGVLPLRGLRQGFFRNLLGRPKKPKTYPRYVSTRKGLDYWSFSSMGLVATISYFI